MKRLTPLAALPGIFCFVLSVRAVSAAEPLRYNRDIRPILSDNCFACHGPDKANRKGGMRLDLREAAVAPAESGDTAIVPGKANVSANAELI